MTIDSPIIKSLLRTYDKQLDSAQRLARYRQTLKSSGVQDKVSISREAKRQQMVQRVAREIVDNLVVSSSRSQVVKEIRQEIEAEFSTRFLFRFSPEKGKIEIHRQTREGSEKISGQESERIMERLWHIALTKVDRTML